MSDDEHHRTTTDRESASIVLIGPIGCGKTTIGESLARRRGLRFLDLDDLRAEHYPALGYDDAEADRREEAGGLPAKIAYWKPFETASVERTLAEYGRGHVIAFGAGQGIQDDPHLAARVRHALGAASAVVLLRVAPDAGDEAAELARRIRADFAEEQTLAERVIDLNQAFICSADNAALATHIVVTEGLTPEESAAVVSRSIGATGPDPESGNGGGP